MPGFEIRAVPTFRVLRGRFAKATTELKETHRNRFARPEGRRFVSIARKHAPKKTGKFAKGIRFRSFIRPNQVGFSVSLPQPLGKWIVLGTKRHPIPIRAGAKTLRFFWPKGFRGPGIYFFKSVEHPGTKPNPFLQAAHDEWLPGAEFGLRQISLKYLTTIQGA